MVLQTPTSTSKSETPSAFSAALTESPIELGLLFHDTLSLQHGNNQLIGARVLFSGEIRAVSHGKQVIQLEYTAHRKLAEKHMQTVIRDAADKFPLIAARCIHRLGLVKVGESAVAVLTCALHRAEAFAANRYIIDRIKAETPIWKKEFFSDGTCAWGNNCNH